MVIPGISQNLISAAQLTKIGVVYKFQSEEVTLLYDNGEFGYGVLREDGLRALACKPVRCNQAMIVAAATGIDL